MTTTVKLSAPVEHAGVTYTQVTLGREPTVADMIIGEKFTGDIARNAAILASISEVPLPAFTKILARDLEKIMAASSKVLGESQDVTAGA